MQKLSDDNNIATYDMTKGTTTGATKNQCEH